MCVIRNDSHYMSVSFVRFVVDLNIVIDMLKTIVYIKNDVENKQSHVIGCHFSKRLSILFLLNVITSSSRLLSDNTILIILPWFNLLGTFLFLCSIFASRYVIFSQKTNEVNAPGLICSINICIWAIIITKRNCLKT